MRMPLLALALTGVLLSSGIALAQQSGGSLSGGANGKSGEPLPNATIPSNQGATGQTTPAEPARTPARLSGGGQRQVGSPDAVRYAGPGYHRAGDPSRAVPGADAREVERRCQRQIGGGSDALHHGQPACRNGSDAGGHRARGRGDECRGRVEEADPAQRAQAAQAAVATTAGDAALTFDRAQQRGAAAPAALDQAMQLRNEGMTDCNAGNRRAGMAKLEQATKRLQGGS